MHAIKINTGTDGGRAFCPMYHAAGQKQRVFVMTSQLQISISQMVEIKMHAEMYFLFTRGNEPRLVSLVIL